MRRPLMQAMLPIEAKQAVEKRTKILHAVREGAYRVLFSFNGLPYQPREVRLFLEEAERKLNLLREGIKTSKGGIQFATIVLNRQTLQSLYLLLLKYGAQVKIERTNYSSSHKLGKMVWRAVHAPS